MRLVENVETVQCLKFNTDHKMVRATLKLNKASLRARPPKASLCIENTDSQIYKNILQKEMKSLALDKEEDVQTLYDKIYNSWKTL